MGRESKFYFIKEYEVYDGKWYGEEVAMIDVANLGYSKEVDDLFDCFDIETEFPLIMNVYDDELKVDRIGKTWEDYYGRRLCYASDNDRLYEAAKAFVKKDDYWRAKALVQMIKTFKDLKIVRFDY